MAQYIHVEVTRTINAPAEQVYAVLSDYRVGHPAILPKPYFKDLTVEQGGQGAGTVFNTNMEVMGVKRRYHMIVTEPQPGRVMAEEDANVGMRTTFTVEPIENGRKTRLTIATDARLAEGFGGIMERLINPPIMRRIYQQEMANIDAYLNQKRTAATTA